MGFNISRDQGSGKTTITVTPDEKNNTEKDIVKILTVEAFDGSRKEVKLIHKAGDAEYEYDFRITPTEVRFGRSGGTKSVTVVSTRQKIINGKKVGAPESVEYTRVNSGDVGGSGNSISMTANPSIINTRSGQVTFTQKDSNKVIQVNCIQDVDEKESTVYTFEVTPDAFQTSSDGGTFTVNIKSYKEELVNGQLLERVELGYTRENGEGTSGSGTTITVEPNEKIGHWEGEGEDKVWVEEEIPRVAYVTFIQNESGEARNVVFSQDVSPDKEEVRYTFTIDPVRFDIDAKEQTINFNLVSTKQTYVNDSPKGDPVKVPYTTSSNASNWVSISDGSFKVSENTGDAGRLATIRFTQSESGKSLVVGIQQEVKKESNAYFLVSSNLQQTPDQGKTSYTDSTSNRYLPSALKETFTITLILTSTDENGNKLDFSVSSDDPYLSAHINKDTDGSRLAFLKSEAGSNNKNPLATNAIVIQLKDANSEEYHDGTITLTQNTTGKKITIHPTLIYRMIKVLNAPTDYYDSFFFTKTIPTKEEASWQHHSVYGFDYTGGILEYNHYYYGLPCNKLGRANETDEIEIIYAQPGEQVYLDLSPLDISKPVNTYGPFTLLDQLVQELDVTELDLIQ